MKSAISKLFILILNSLIYIAKLIYEFDLICNFLNKLHEILIWAKEQKEESIPNLSTFTEHFNNMSYWARSQILKCQDQKEREKFMQKFLKIMKYLRKLNNFNSYLAILSALDSAPISRLEWPKVITDSIKEYGSLIDSSSSFRTYRNVLASSKPPCIPYM